MTKLIVKVTTPWRSKFLYNTIEKDNMYLSQSPNSNGLIGNFQFEVNNDVNECDFWFVYGGLTVGEFKSVVNCPPENIYYITDETHDHRLYVQKFIDQFPTVITCRTDLRHRNIINYHEILIWYLDKTYDEIINTTFIPKNKNLCIINSNLTTTPLQRRRYELTHKLIGHFKDKIDVYGRGYKTFVDKWAILKDYKYSIAIENTIQPGYFTEKISECFLTHTYPLYFGCPDIANYYNSDSFTLIDVFDYKTCIHQVEEILESNKYEEKLPLILEQKQKYLEEYHFFPAIANIITTYGRITNLKRRKNTIYHENYFKKMYYVKRFIQILNNKNVLGKYKFNINFLEDAAYSNKIDD